MVLYPVPGVVKCLEMKHNDGFHGESLFNGYKASVLQVEGHGG